MENIFQEAVFARKFASNIKVIREKTLKEVKVWFRIKNNDKNQLGEEDFLRVWRGLYYCLWMSDKPLIQEEVCEKISLFVHCWPKSLRNFGLFLKTFFITMKENWFGLDHFHLDKFLMLVRRMNRQILFYLVQHDDIYTNNQHWELFSNIILENLLQKTDNSLSLAFHFIDLILEELAKVTNGKFSTSKLVILLRPFMITFLKTYDKRLRNHIEKNIFMYILRQNPLVLKKQEQYRAWKEAGKPGNSYLDMVLVEPDDNESNEELETNDALDPRAGKVDVILNEIDFDSDEIVKVFKSLLDTIQTKPVVYRRALALCKSFEKLGQGISPFIKNDLNKKKKEIKNELLCATIQNAKQTKRKHNQEDVIPPKKTKFENIETVSPSNNNENNINEENETVKGKIATENNKNKNSASNKIKKKKKKNLKDIKDKLKKEKENKLNEINTIKLNGEVKEKIMKKKTIYPEIKLQDTSAHTNNKTTKRKLLNNPIKVKNTSSFVELNNEPENEEFKNKSTNENMIKKYKNKKNMCQTNIQDNIKNKNQISKLVKKSKIIEKKLKKESLKTNNISTSMLKTSNQNQNNTPKDSSKRVSIQLKLNKTQEFKDYCKNLKENPHIPCSEKKVLNGILKPSISTPTNPFYQHPKMSKKKCRRMIN